ncbi:hypothetical protein LPB72_00985 [Hydrogenophaga crassostreae]|uniref:Uncharacterized protein n=1 Tax=Hydrogenophaga crassostreae TaxID=1763535 RepID=A0A162PDZ7_9BURK|nr:hypothetical protein LPB072_14830 [Hydrogenophaga crassostreae]OAD44117.1 hypothetical protein LPB72_00985 [Hydrogenophaga crassostreae]
MEDSDGLWFGAQGQGWMTKGAAVTGQANGRCPPVRAFYFWCARTVDALRRCCLLPAAFGAQVAMVRQAPLLAALACN